jgi:hypothetical protein
MPNAYSLKHNIDNFLRNDNEFLRRFAVEPLQRFGCILELRRIVSRQEDVALIEAEAESRHEPHVGDVSFFRDDLTRRTGRDTAVIDDAERPVPLSFRWSMEPLDDTLEELVTTGQDPVYVVHFTQAAAVEHATNLLRHPPKKVDKEAIAERIGTPTPPSTPPAPPTPPVEVGASG